ncbi:putative transcription initiation factor TFIID subunit 1 [Helianthus anomalus]
MLICLYGFSLILSHGACVNYRHLEDAVCAYESMLAGMYRLKRLGISLNHPAGLSSAMNQLPDEAIALVVASHIEHELQIIP